MIDRIQELKNEISEKLLPTKLFNDEMKQRVELVRKSVREGKIQEFAPRLIVTSMEDYGKRSMRIIGLGGFPDTTAEKAKVMTMLGLACAANDLKVVMAVFEVEAWTAEEKRDPKTIPDEEWVRPSERPDRKEIILVAARSIDGREATATLPIVGRNEDKSLILGKENVQEFAEKSEVQIQDNLLSQFFEAMAAGTLAKLHADILTSQGKEIPEEVQQMVVLLDECPIKL